MAPHEGPDGERASGPKGWHRPVRPGGLLVVATVLVLGWGALMVGGVWFFYLHWESRITVREQRMTLRLQSGTPAQAHFETAVPVQVPRVPALTVPIRQQVSVMLDDTVHARVRLHTVVPVQTTLSVRQDVPVRTTLTATVPLIWDWLPRVEVSVPVAMTVPVALAVPVQTRVPLDLDVLVSAALPPTLFIPLETVVRVQPILQGPIWAQVQEQVAVRWLAPEAPIPMTISEARLRVPFDLVGLSTR